MGADFNAFTGKEYTGYYIKCTRDQAAQAFDVLADMLFHSRFDPEEIEREKGVIVEEMNMYRDTPAQYLPDVYDDLSSATRRSAVRSSATRTLIRGASRDTFTGYSIAGTPRAHVRGARRRARGRGDRRCGELFGSRPVFDTADYEPYRTRRTSV